MHGPITTHLATETVNEELRLARDRQRRAIHTRQRSFVLASLLLRRAVATSRPTGARSRSRADRCITTLADTSRR